MSYKGDQYVTVYGNKSVYLEWYNEATKQWQGFADPQGFLFSVNPTTGTSKDSYQCRGIANDIGKVWGTISGMLELRYSVHAVWLSNDRDENGRVVITVTRTPCCDKVDVDVTNMQSVQFGSANRSTSGGCIPSYGPPPGNEPLPCSFTCAPWNVNDPPFYEYDVSVPCNDTQRFWCFPDSFTFAFNASGSHKSVSASHSYKLVCSKPGHSGTYHCTMTITNGGGGGSLAHEDVAPSCADSQVAKGVHALVGLGPNARIEMDGQSQCCVGYNNGGIASTFSVYLIANQL